MSTLQSIVDKSTSESFKKLNVPLAPRQSTDEAELNNLERAWLVEMRRRNYQEIGIQSHTLKLADMCRYTPDFFALVDGVPTFFEVKGFMRDDAQVKLKVAARLHRIFKFVLVTRENKKLGGAWKEVEVKP